MVQRRSRGTASFAHPFREAAVRRLIHEVSYKFIEVIATAFGFHAGCFGLHKNSCRYTRLAEGLNYFTACCALRYPEHHGLIANFENPIDSGLCFGRGYFQINNYRRDRFNQPYGRYSIREPAERFRGRGRAIWMQIFGKTSKGAFCLRKAGRFRKAKHLHRRLKIRVRKCHEAQISGECVPDWLMSSKPLYIWLIEEVPYEP